LFFVFVFLFFNRATANTSEPIIAHNSSKDAVWCKEDPFLDPKFVIVKFGVFNPKNIIMDHYLEVIVAYSESVMKNRLNRPMAAKSR